MIYCIPACLDDWLSNLSPNWLYDQLTEYLDGLLIVWLTYLFMN